MFATTNKLLLDYLRVVIDGGTIPTANDRRDLAIELHEIIIGLDFIIERVIKLEKKITVLSELREATTPSFESSKEKHARVELKLLTQSFYYSAARARAVARNTKFPLPGLKSFECAGVRDVRNKLLEHPGGSDSQVFVVSFMRGGNYGPVIKPLRRVGQENVFPDAGLFINAEEFKSNLELLLTNELKRNGS